MQFLHEYLVVGNLGPSCCVEKLLREVVGMGRLLCPPDLFSTSVGKEPLESI